MIWNLLPYLIVDFPIAIVLDILLFPIWIKQAWIELYWNIYWILNIFVEIALTPYYCVAFFFTIFSAMAQRPMYQDMSSAVANFLGVEGLPPLDEEEIAEANAQLEKDASYF